MGGLIIAFALAAIFGTLIYGLRLFFIREPDQMRRFLDRRFDVIRRKGFWGEERDYIDAAMIKRRGHSGWGLIFLPAFNLSLDLDQLLSIEKLPSLSLLVFAGMIFSDSRASIHFLRALGVEQYRKQAELDSREQ